MTQSDKKIATAIIYAQIASDGGKGKGYESLLPKAEKVYSAGYSVKVKYILNAINAINKSRNSMFRYSATETEDQNGYDSIVVYFEYRLNGKRKQVSFHVVPREYTPTLRSIAYSKRKMKTEWTEKSNSRCNTYELEMAM